jgi:hypothetical protein
LVTTEIAQCRSGSFNRIRPEWFPGPSRCIRTHAAPLDFVDRVRFDRRSVFWIVTGGRADACPDAMSAGRDQERPVGFPKRLDEATGSAVLQALADGVMAKHMDRARIGRNWSKLKKTYLTKIVNAQSERAFYDAIRAFTSEGFNPPVRFLSPYQRNFSGGGNGPAFGGIGGMSISNPSGGSTVLWCTRIHPCVALACNHVTRCSS